MPTNFVSLIVSVLLLAACAAPAPVPPDASAPANAAPPAARRVVAPPTAASEIAARRAGPPVSAAPADPPPVASSGLRPPAAGPGPAATPPVAASATRSTPMAQDSGRGRVSGTGMLDEKAIELHHAIAFTGEDVFDRHREVTYVLITADPVFAETIASARKVDELRDRAGPSVLALLRPDAMWLRIRVPGSDRELQLSESGAGVEFLGQSVRGRLAPAGGKESDMFGKKFQLDVEFDLPIVARFDVARLPAPGLDAKALPAGGGEPGRAYVAECRRKESLVKDFASFRQRLIREGAAPSPADARAESARTGRPVTADQMMRQLYDMASSLSELSPKNCRVLGGRADASVAIIEIEATLTGIRQRTEIVMVKDGTLWRMEKEGTWRASGPAKPAALPPPPASGPARPSASPAPPVPAGGTARARAEFERRATEEAGEATDPSKKCYSEYAACQVRYLQRPDYGEATQTRYEGECRAALSRCTGERK